MRINCKTLIEGRNIGLVPYCPHHVLQYHQWMQSAELRAQTASEPLTLSQEYQMQQSWQQDEDKCTFIILARKYWNGIKDAEIESMIGDVNLFFNNPNDPHTAEIEIMIAKSEYRRKGFGSEALQAMMIYGITQLNTEKFVAKIGMDNTPSICLFNKLGFQQIDVSKVFEEVTLQFDTTHENVERLNKATCHLKTKEYHRE
ncbi:uncharacterized protein TRIADDRAFT_20514 [Trichoplax adhaerens]|uniref:N-acetyltransferase 9-like protein n=1 Tax=Trichoplax adhaerens TaxID=10228 RepID=B3RMK6_TRIAD|nr:hypothetical protein TRIADDRAFT_20514 [Trichoplax adhaerens]EDV27866.1 hypothetical protein TRIADDRAFT_20514 [Trichoplax adhaerens]|eukprot:XP_002109700.1 hypothetical protein TRIADDRAFT_20514 [Trichoplax adhaerens]